MVLLQRQLFDSSPSKVLMLVYGAVAHYKKMCTLRHLYCNNFNKIVAMWFFKDICYGAYDGGGKNFILTPKPLFPKKIIENCKPPSHSDKSTCCYVTKNTKHFTKQLKNTKNLKTPSLISLVVVHRSSPTMTITHLFIADSYHNPNP
jgi:hypothetical protein